MDGGKFIVLAFGETDDFHVYLEIFNTINRIDVAWMRNGKAVAEWDAGQAGWGVRDDRLSKLGFASKL